ncbi:hypothetical protein E2C01_009284 [Portunus trituberculatus]|uniref:Uncharacterized protein n=1 Tax=Portunus trituberculatus TaxID=210409 RepID=A0A5B7D445_PORTR|nr:hypothetical protein [Portunus trituberculatus]
MHVVESWGYRWVGERSRRWRRREVAEDGGKSGDVTSGHVSPRLSPECRSSTTATSSTSHSTYMFPCYPLPRHRGKFQKGEEEEQEQEEEEVVVVVVVVNGGLGECQEDKDDKDEEEDDDGDKI